jgi:hypothetical protein
MGGLSAAELQRPSLAALGFLFAQVITVEEMIEKIERSAPRTYRKPKPCENVREDLV